MAAATLRHPITRTIGNDQHPLVGAGVSSIPYHYEDEPDETRIQTTAPTLMTLGGSPANEGARYRDKAWDYRWRLTADNGEVIADSGEEYRRKTYAIKAEELFPNAEAYGALPQTTSGRTRRRSSSSRATSGSTPQPKRDSAQPIERKRQPIFALGISYAAARGRWTRRSPSGSPPVSGATS
jgi:uncharacterized protein YegP (UPF0339 family)